MIGGVVQCPWHGSQFDCRSGLVRAGPAKQPIGSYPVTEREGKVMLSLA
jgi:nitrite reductase/ring-hydroxylating ferredoxin subunit